LSAGITPSLEGEGSASVNVTELRGKYRDVLPPTDKGASMKHRFVIKQYLLDGEVCCSMSCSFWSYEAGCRLGCADGSGHPDPDCLEPGVYVLTREDHHDAG
jgi:hypothetical protein